MGDGYVMKEGESNLHNWYVSLTKSGMKFSLLAPICQSSQGFEWLDLLIWKKNEPMEIY